VNDTERWLPVVGYEGLYEVSDHGRVRTVERFITYPSKSRITTSGRLLPSQIRKQYCRPNDHPTVGLVRPGEKRRTFDVHRLVLEAFVGPRPEGMEACHWNDIKTDNRASNLRWDTRSENTKDRIRNGIHPPSNKTHCDRGHERTPENIKVISLPGGRIRRRCLRCQEIVNEQHRRKRHAHRAANPIVRATHCPNGHEYTAENTYVQPNGRYRYCRTCNRAAAAERRRAA
jgi:hypothetical protein